MPASREGSAIASSCCRTSATRSTSAVRSGARGRPLIALPRRFDCAAPGAKERSQASSVAGRQDVQAVRGPRKRVGKSGEWGAGGEETKERCDRAPGRPNASIRAQDVPGGHPPLAVHPWKEPLGLRMLKRDGPQAAPPVPGEQLARGPSAEATISVVQHDPSIHRSSRLSPVDPGLRHRLGPKGRPKRIIPVFLGKGGS